MFVCEMIDYPEGRDATPHAGRISGLEDADGDGFYEKATVFAGDLAWPTGLICVNGGVYVIATPDILFLKDSDGDGRAHIRETIFTGLGAGLPKLNVQGLANSPQWGLDNRIHVQCGGGNRENPLPEASGSGGSGVGVAATARSAQIPFRAGSGRRAVWNEFRRCGTPLCLQ